MNAPANNIEELKLDRSNWALVKFGDVAIQQKESVDRGNTDITRYVKGEHMGSEDLHLREWGELKDEYLGPAFIRRFKEGDILYGSRRTYLRKVVIAPFEGITSNTTFVIKANEDTIDKRLLPFVMMSEGFTEHSIRNSKGSVNPYVNWKDLTGYEFLLPPKEQQQELAELLWAMDDVVQKLKIVNEKLEETIRALRRGLNVGELQLIFGREITSLITKGASPKWQGFDYCDDGMLFVTSENVLDGVVDLSKSKFLPIAFHEKLSRSQLKRNDVLINIVGASIGRMAIFSHDVESANINQAVCLFRCNGKARPEYVVQYLLEEQNKKRLLNVQSDTARPNLSLKNLNDYKFSLPSIEEQDRRLIKINEVLDAKGGVLSQTKKSSALNKILLSEIFYHGI